MNNDKLREAAQTFLDTHPKTISKLSGMTNYHYGHFRNFMEKFAKEPEEQPCDTDTFLTAVRAVYSPTESLRKIDLWLAGEYKEATDGLSLTPTEPMYKVWIEDPMGDVIQRIEKPVTMEYVEELQRIWGRYPIVGYVQYTQIGE
jgi:hypothetical protein